MCLIKIIIFIRHHLHQLALQNVHTIRVLSTFQLMQSIRKS
jgi:hypothetical protein